MAASYSGVFAGLVVCNTNRVVRLCPALKSSISLIRQDLRPYENPPDFFVKGKELRELSTWGIGGPAKYFVEVTDEAQLVTTLRYCRSHDVRYFVVGKGSNCLFDDRGFDGCVLLSSLDFLEHTGDGVFRAGSGYPFNLLGLRCSKEKYTGLEFACGIPGTVGGAVFMNAGADGQMTSESLTSVETLNADGERVVHVNDGRSMGYGYRRSPFQTMGGFFAIVAATFELQRCANARERQRTFLERRRRTQPISERSAGCVFRNPGRGSQSAGALIEQAALKGVAVGDAQVSDIHANFLVNTGVAKAEEMRSLILLVKEQVRTKLGVDLQEEIVYVPFN